MGKAFYKKHKLQQLKGFCAVVEEGGIVKAAEKLKIPASNVSVQISSLEEEIGFELFRKSGRKLFITENGKEIYNYLKYHIQGIDYFYSTIIKNIKNKNDTTIRIACHPLISGLFIPQILGKIYKQYPQTQFCIFDIIYEEAIKKIQNNELDIAIYPKDANIICKEDNIVYEKLWQYKATAFCHKNHKIAKMKTENIKINDIFDRFVNTNAGYVIDYSYQQMKNKQQIQSNYAILYKTVLAIEGIAVTDELYKYICEKNNDLIIKNIEHITPNVYFYFIQSKSNFNFNNTSLLMVHPLLTEMIANLEY